MRLITNSEVRTYRDCPRKHYYAYHLGARPAEEPTALRFGSVVHKMLEAHLTGQEFDWSVAGDLKEADRVRAEEMMAGYKIRWENDGLKVLGVEVRFEVPLINPETGASSRTFSVGGKIDAIVSGSDDDIYIMEHKTSSMDISPGSDYWEALKLDQQISIYYMGAKSSGYDVVGCIYDVLKKPQHRPGKRDNGIEDFRVRVNAAIAEDPEKYYRRGKVVRLSEEENEAAFDLWQQTKMIRESERFERWPRNPSECLRFGRCPYFEVCCGQEDIRNPFKFRFREKRHEELS